MHFLQWFRNLVQPKRVKYRDASVWAADYFPEEERDVAARVGEILVEQLAVEFNDLTSTTQFIRDLKMARFRAR